MGDIIPYENNPRNNDGAVDAVAASIKEFGFKVPIVIDKNNVIVAGHTRYKASEKLGLETVPCIIADDLNEQQIKAYRLADNKVGELADWDFGALEMELEGIDEIDMEQFGFEPAIDENEEVVEDEVPETPEESKTQKGYLWVLGRHRLLCGDATNPEEVSVLMGGQQADLYLTDPPYNVSLGQNKGHPLRPSEAKQLHRRQDNKIIQNDSWDSDEAFIEFLVASFNAAMGVSKAGAAFYIWYADNQGLNFRTACKQAEMQIRQNLIWNKSVFAFGRQDYQWKHEPCLYGWKDGGAHAWFSDRKQSTVLDFEKPSKSEEHPTMKPVKLFDYLIKNSSKAGDIVLDSFGGSGTTIIACEQNGRCGYCTELDPIYCDVIVKRYINLKGSSDDVYLMDGDKKVPYKDIFDE